MSAKRKKKKQRSGSTSLGPRRLPKPKVTLARGQRFRPASKADSPLVTHMVELQGEVCQATGQPPFLVWQDWLLATEVWLRAIGDKGELGAVVELPAEAERVYTAMNERYARLSAEFPAAYRKMGETFTLMFRLLADSYPLIDLAVCARQPRGLHPDILGQSFWASLGYPGSWGLFFPDWESEVKAARQALPYDDLKEEVYTQLALAHGQAQRVGAENLTMPTPGYDESWQAWLTTIFPYVSPVVISQEVTSSTGLLAIASQLPDWMVKNGFVQFFWPKLAGDPVLNKIVGINAMLYGLNGFYIGKAIGNVAAVEALEAAIAELPDDELQPPPVPALAPSPLGQQPAASSFQSIFQKKGGSL